MTAKGTPRPPTAQWTPEMIAELRRRREAGETMPVIAAALGLTVKVVAWKAGAMRLKAPERTRPDLDALRPHWIAGVSADRLGEMAGVKGETVSRWAKKQGWPDRVMTPKIRVDLWTEAEDQIIIDAGYDRSMDAILAMLPGRTRAGVQTRREILIRAGRMTRPVKFARGAEAPKPVKAAKEKQVPRLAPQPIPEPDPVSDAPAVELAPDQERVRILPWPQVQAVGLAHGLELRTLADHQKLVNLLIQLGKPPVFIRRSPQR